MKKQPTADKYDILVEKMLESSDIQRLYNEYIIKDITFKEWVVGMIDSLYARRNYDADHVLASLEQKG